MPTVFLDRLPLPSLQAYVSLSLILLTSSIFYAIQVTSQPNWKLNSTAVVVDDKFEDADENVTALPGPSNSDFKVESESHYRVTEVFFFMIEEPLCIWILINMAYCCLILIGKVIQGMVFGELRVSEQQHIKDKFWNFVFYKFIFIFGVMNVQFMDEVVLWCGWFSVLGFLHLLAQLCKDRFEYLSFSPTTPKWTHVRLLSLLVGILVNSSALFIICILVGFNAGINTFAFMAAECILLNVQTLYVIVRYAIHLYDMNLEGVWENRGTYIYYAELVFELTALVIDFLHHLHMLLWGNIFLSMASLVICMQLRCLFHEMQRRIKKHKNFLRVVQHLEKNFPMTTAEELEANTDNCAICWDKMESARKLPCGHLFHNSCLRSWLEQDTSCPTCRTSLASESGGSGSSSGEGEEEGDIPPPIPQNRPTTNHFFHFDGSRYVSWLPSFSVEVTHLQLTHERQQAVQTSQLDSMAYQVQQMFSNMPLNLIMDDLRITRSVEQTIENILEERLVASPFQSQVSRLNSNHPEVFNQELTSSESSYSSDNNSNASGENSDNELDMQVVETNWVPEEKEIINNEDPEPQPCSCGGRFSKSPREREKMLAARKDEMIKQAKRMYLTKHSPNDNRLKLMPFKSVTLEGTGIDSAESRRYLAYEAAKRRIQRRQSDK